MLCDLAIIDRLWLALGGVTDIAAGTAIKKKHRPLMLPVEWYHQRINPIKQWWLYRVLRPRGDIIPPKLVIEESYSRSSSILDLTILPVSNNYRAKTLRKSLSKNVDNCSYLLSKYRVRIGDICNRN